MPMTDDVVTRLYRCLVDRLQEHGYVEGEGVRVSRLYEEIVPYRAVRHSLGVDLNADYEHALLRLLAGERELVRLEPESAREELRREAEAPYPAVGAFRDYAGCLVQVRLPSQATEAEPGHEDPPAPGSDEPEASHRTEAAAPASEEPASERPCPYCDEPLPQGLSVHFCPHCGGDQERIACPRCGAELERGWRYCIGCGAEAPLW